MEAVPLLFLSFERATLRILNKDINGGGEIDSFSALFPSSWTSRRLPHDGAGDGVRLPPTKGPRGPSAHQLLPAHWTMNSALRACPPVTPETNHWRKRGDVPASRWHRGGGGGGGILSPPPRPCMCHHPLLQAPDPPAP